MVRVTGLVYYPVKGCAGTSVRSADVGPAGLAHDREFMVVAPDGVFRSQRRHPVMAAIRPVVLDGGRRLALSAPGVGDFVLDVVAEGDRHRAENFRWQGEAVHQGDAAAEWFSAVLGVPSVLVRVAPDHERITHGERAGTAWFADGHALLVLSESSLDNLNDRILERGAEPVPMDRFRPNMIVSGWREPHTEDEVREMSIGGVGIGYAMKCVRCTVPMVDQETGAKAGPEPIRSLAGYRRDPEGGVVFGMKAVVTRPGQVAVGDAVIVSSWAGPTSSASAADPRLIATASRPAESV
ncbi:MOSC domain-containing protein [Amycolatopsis sp. H20-H5]|uniref:MOSC domain-containing protein n=1 Tax=Amycolatopsis sp. H20-H5 TaxID=3046309 RepID=UPI002DC0215B|nr:MOSC N-terminal beta barrel domain-containing protein [Amycolatopsis sp. H20-H5]MEC3977060.1 MOSC N-terminal beta barrel domain-containing protein [Amycolatopsis sp. H20-H5]